MSGQSEEMFMTTFLETDEEREFFETIFHLNSLILTGCEFVSPTNRRTCRGNKGVRDNYSEPYRESNITNARKKHTNSCKKQDSTDGCTKKAVTDSEKSTTSNQLETNKTQGNMENNATITETETISPDSSAKTLKKRLKRQRQKEKKKLTKAETKEDTIDVVETCTSVPNNCAPSVSNLEKIVEISENDDAIKAADSTDEEIDVENDEFDFVDNVPAFVSMALKKTGKSLLNPTKNQKSTNMMHKEQSANNNTELSIAKEDENFTYVKGKRSKQLVNLQLSETLGIRAVTFIMKNDISHAIQSLSEAIVQNPLCVYHYVNRSFCYLRSKQYLLAIADAQHIIQHFSDMEALAKAKYILAQCLYCMKNYEDAEKALTECLSTSPSNIYLQKELLRIRVVQMTELGFNEKDAICAASNYNTTLRAIEMLMEQSSENKEQNVSNEINIEDKNKVYYLDDNEGNWHSLLLLTL